MGVKFWVIIRDIEIVNMVVSVGVGIVSLYIGGKIVKIK